MDVPIKRTFLAYVEDRPGVLNRVASLFRRRGYNIESLTVGSTEKVGVSRITFVMKADADNASRIEANLYKMVDVLEVKDITNESSVMRDLAVIKVAVSPENRAELLKVCEVFHVKVVDMIRDSLIVEMAAHPEKIDSFVQVLIPFGIREMVRTGPIAMLKGSFETKWETGEGSGKSEFAA
jgi:acetolactate synthase I/III small subunit